ncbi:predicted protein [Sclerotinia sclerotiorum 1980 UF-70]|uniref:Uncharacterized protein n=1 Tax=Sclerotinia sclerotiorum (strain ATCC 18683 / 1980 / Ss-1) TaxID=665079 RepID=A7EFV3_SCLS1|nr:predicted protein [Sclerotinia sclerotiorum 1980 UF-70]EDO01719.1 predicted protein [Sclerotinia sclerotiorum 1980 UF-70]
MPPVPQPQGHPGGQTIWNKPVGAILGFMYVEHALLWGGGKHVYLGSRWKPANAL